jgi:hypothetical protein
VEFTNEQRKLINDLEAGVIQDDFSDRENEILAYLQGLGIATPRADIRDGLWRLTQKGESVLQELRSRGEQVQKEADQKAQQQAERKAETRRDRIFQVLLALFSAVIGALLANVDRLGALFAAVRDIFAD